MKLLLIVSSEISIQESLRMILKDDFSILQAKTGNEAIMLIAQHPIDIVLIDTNILGLNGFEFLEKLKEISENISILLITPSRSNNLIPQLSETSYYDIITKPFDKDEVRWIVKRAMEHKRLLEETRILKGRLQLDERKNLPIRSTYPEEEFHQKDISVLYPYERSFFSLYYALKEFFKSLTHVTELDRLIEFVVHSIADVFQVNKAAILLYNPIKYEYRVKASLGIDENRLKDFSLELGKGLPSWFLRNNQIIRKEMVERDILSRENMLVNEQLKLLDAKISAPLMTKGKLVGIMSLGNKLTGRPFTDRDIELLSMISNYTAIAIENSLLYREIYLQKKYNENILRHIASGVIAIDQVGRITTYNPAAERIMGIPYEEVIGKNIQKLGSVFADILLKTVEGTDIFNRHEVLHPITKAPMGISTSILKDENNLTTGAIMVFTDLTDSKELEAKTKDLERLRFWSILANRMAQEIKNPLVAVKTFAQLLPEKYEDEEFRKSFFQVVTGEIDTLDKIAERLLEFAQPAENRFEKEDINQLIELAIQAKSEQINSQNTRVIKNLSSDPISVHVDRNQIIKAITHILDNSLEAMPNGGKIRIKTQKRRQSPFNGKYDPSKKVKEWVEIEIEDTGKGIPLENLPDIFSPFFTTKIKGMGFGLPIAQRIIQDHMGRIEVQSEEGKGTNLKIILPISPLHQ
jgi:PAS domain S-box-containing protein